VLPEDLVCQEDIVTNDGQFLVRKGEYNPYNKWNTTHGIAHLCSPPNTLVAEIGLGAEATIPRKDGRGLTLAEPDALIFCAAYGGPDRNSDPTIGAAVNALARPSTACPKATTPTRARTGWRTTTFASTRTRSPSRSRGALRTSSRWRRPTRPA